MSPVQGEKGISRRIDFEKEFPEGIDVLRPVPMNIAVMAPANVLVPQEGMNFGWTMPILTRMVPAEALPAAVTEKLSGKSSSSKTRPGVEVVTFLPFPRADAPSEEQFRTEFYVTLSIDAHQLGATDNYFGAIVKYGDKIVSQFVTSERTNILVFADPYHQTLFQAEMLVGLSSEELAKTPEKAGTLDIFVYRISKGYNFKKMLDVGSLLDFGTGLNSPSRGLLTFGGGDLFRGGSPTRGGGFPSLSSITGGGQKPALPTPASVPKEAGDTRVKEGTAGQAVEYSSLEGYSFDSSFAVQRISLRCIGVREAAREATIAALESIAAEPK